MSYPDNTNQMDEPQQRLRPLPGGDGLDPRTNPTTGQGANTPEALKERELTLHAKAAPSSPTLPHRSVTWVRASDLLTHGAGQLAGGGIAVSHALNRVPRRAVGLGSRSRLELSASDAAPVERRSRLAPLSAFGLRRDRPNRLGLTR